MIATDMIFEAKQLGPGARSFDLSMDTTRPMISGPPLVCLVSKVENHAIANIGHIFGGAQAFWQSQSPVVRKRMLMNFPTRKLPFWCLGTAKKDRNEYKETFQS